MCSEKDQSSREAQIGEGEVFGGSSRVTDGPGFNYGSG